MLVRCDAGVATRVSIAWFNPFASAPEIGHLLIAPIEKEPKRRSAVTVFRLFLSGKFGKGPVNLRKIEQRIVSESIRAAGSIEDQPFGHTAKCVERSAVAGSHQHADKSSGALFRWNIFQFPQNPGIVGFIICICIREMRLVGGVTR